MTADAESAAGSANRITVRIADLVISAVSLNAALPIALEGPVARFASEPVQSDIELEVAFATGSAPAGRQLTFDSGGVWRLYRTAAGEDRFELSGEEAPSTPYKTATFPDSDLRRGVVELHPALHPAREGLYYPLEYPLDELLMVHLLAEGRGVEMHSCGVIDDQGRGHLFVGVSGGGKTTTARIWAASHRGARILSDDRIIVRDQNGELRMHGTPWHGEAELSEQRSAPLHRVYLLEQAAVNELVARPVAELVSRLFTCAFPLFYRTDSVAWTLGFLEELTRRVEVVELRFVPDASVLQTVLGS